MRSSRGSLRAWSQSRGPTGAFASVQLASLLSPAVEHSSAGARRSRAVMRSSGGFSSARLAVWIAFTQTVGSPLEVRSEVDGFLPRLATRRVRHGWTGVLYPHLQTRLHVALGRRYFARLRAEAAR